MKRAVVLGGGMVGQTMAMDLALGPQPMEVTLVDAREEPLARARQRYGVATERADLSDPAKVRELVAGHDVVLGALASTLGEQTLRAVIEAGKSCCDISFMEQDPRHLSALARERGATVVYDCGVAPGMTNMLAGWAARELDPCDSIDLYVGGVPEVRMRPFEYKAGFAPHDVLEEYTRPSRLVEQGRQVVRDALSGVEHLDFPGIGTLEAFYTDGLRSLVDTLDVPNMREKTMRWPGHADLMRALRDTGLFGKEPVEVGGVSVRPLDLTAALLFPKWTFEPGEVDLLVLKVVAEGRRDGARTRYEWHMSDRYDPETDTRAMSRTTAFPATIMARLIADGTFREPGVHPPEVPARRPGVLETVLAELERRGVRYEARVQRLD